MLHALIVVPFYFFAAVLTFLVLALACRIVRAKIGANPLATTAVILAVGVVAVPLSLDWIDLEHMNGRRLLVLAAATLVLAAIDTLLQPLLPLPADHDLADL